MKFGLSQKVITQMNHVFAQHPKIKKVILYGSRAKGTYHPGSDIDLTMLGESLTTRDLLRIENELDNLLLPYKIDLSLLHHIHEQDLMAHIQRVGCSFYPTGPNP